MSEQSPKETYRADGGFSPFPPGEGPECPECGAALVERGGMASRTLMAGPTPGYDEEGEYHNHDPNWSKSTYKCENGHTVRRSTRSSCPAPNCDYGGEEKLVVLDE